jgi:hypothetical protein
MIHTSKQLVIETSENQSNYSDLTAQNIMLLPETPVYPPVSNDVPARINFRSSNRGKQ